MEAKKILLENDSHSYLIDGDEWTSVDRQNWSQAAGSEEAPLAVISDFGTNPEFRQVYGDVRYSKFLLHKELRDAGEAVGNSELLTHQVSKVDQLNSRLLYSLISKRELEEYQAGVQRMNARALLFSFYSLYSQAFKQFGAKEPTAFVFVLSGGIDIAIVNQGVVESFESLSGFSAQSLNDALLPVSINALADNITTQERIARLKLSKLCIFELIQNETPWQEDLAAKVGLPLHRVPSQSLTLDRQSRRSSIAPLLKKLSVFSALSSADRRAESLSRSWLPAVAAVMIGVCVGLYFFTEKIQQRSEQHQQKLVQLQATLSAEEPLEAIRRVDYQRQLGGIESILQAGIQPSYYQYINRVAQASDVGNPVTYDSLEVKYPQGADNRAVELNLVGFIDSGWTSPLIAFDKLTGNFASKGFEVKDTVIDVVDGGLSFAYRLVQQPCQQGDACDVNQ